MDNQRTLLYVGLAMVMFLMWSSWQQDYGPKPPVEVTSSQEQSQIPGAAPPALDVPSAVEKQTTVGAVAATPVSAQPSIHVVTDKLDLNIDSRGGNIGSLNLLDYPQSTELPDQPFALLTEQGDDYFVAQSGLVSANATQAPTHHAVYASQQSEYRLDNGQDTLTVPLYWQSSDGVRVVKTFTFHRDSYVIDVKHQVLAAGQPWSGSQYRQLVRSGVEKKDNQFIYTYTGGVIYNEEDKFQKIKFDDIAEGKVAKQFKNGWAGMIQHYFLAAWVPESQEDNYYYSKNPQSNRFILGLRSAQLQLAAGETGEFTSRLVVGPKLQDKLEAIAPGLELTVDYGILTIIAKPLFWLLKWFHGFFGNWGWAIIFLTIVIKLAFYKLSETSYKSMAKMRKLAPRLKTLKERHGDDRQAMSHAMMEMYKKEKINPMGGCFPILIQIPVFIALYWVLLETVEMRNAPFMLWIDNLSAKDPYFVLPVIMGISMFLQFKLNPAPMDPIQQKVFQFMPIIFTVFFAFFPSGLVLYWVVNNILSIAQQYVITRRIEAG